MAISERDLEHVFERLRHGVVPERGLETFAVGIEHQRLEVHRQLDLAQRGEGAFKFLRGGYGCGKTFLARLAVRDAMERGFATSFVVVSDNDLHFHRFDDVYRKVVQELGTSACPRGALGDIIDRWIARVEEALLAGGADEEAADFDQQVMLRMDQELQALTGGRVPEDMTRVLRTLFTLKQEGRLDEAGALLSWLSGSENVAAGAKRVAGVKGDIGSKEALGYLHGLLEIVKAAGYRGLLIVIDEVETILRMRRDVRGKSLNGIRQIIDAADRFHGLLWIFTGTPEFFDTRRGVAGLAPLDDRIRFLRHGDFANPRQAQLELRPMDATRLREVALKLRELYPTADREALARKVSSDFVEQLVEKVTAGFAGDVGVVPRQFLRRFIDVLDLATHSPDFDPMTALGFEPRDLSEPEDRALRGESAVVPEPGDDEGYEPIVF